MLSVLRLGLWVWLFGCAIKFWSTQKSDRDLENKTFRILESSHPLTQGKLSPMNENNLKPSCLFYSAESLQPKATPFLITAHGRGNGAHCRDLRSGNEKC